MVMGEFIIMNKYRNLIIILIFLATVRMASASENFGDIKKIVFLPFYDLADSDMKYLSKYIPELLKKNFVSSKEVTLLDTVDIEMNLESDGITPALLYHNNGSMDFLKKIGADIGVVGRYIIHDKSIKIDYRVIYVADGSVVNGKEYSGTIDERFLGSLEKFSITRDAWIRKEVLNESIADKMGISNSISEIVRELRGSSIGIMLTSSWVLAIIVIIIFYIASKITSIIFKKVLMKLALRTETLVDDQIVELSRKPVKWIVFIIGFKAAILILDFKSSFMWLMDNLLTAVIILLSIYIATGSFDIIIRSWGNKLTDRLNTRIDDQIVPLFVKVAKIQTTVL